MNKQSTGKIILFSMYFAAIASFTAAQSAVITAEQVQDWLRGSNRVVIVDVRTYEEYREGHIPGAINIPSERIATERALLPRDKSTPLILYCRGIG